MSDFGLFVCFRRASPHHLRSVVVIAMLGSRTVVTEASQCCSAVLFAYNYCRRFHRTRTFAHVAKAQMYYDMNIITTVGDFRSGFSTAKKSKAPAYPL